MSGETQTQQQDQPSIVPMFDPKGNVREIPAAQADAAKKAGGRLAVKMTDPKGTQRWIPESMVDQALKAGGKKVETGPDFTSNPVNPKTGKGEGLYEMTNEAGDTIKVPYSKVIKASEAGYRTPQKERERFARDQTADVEKRTGERMSSANYEKQALPEVLPEEPGLWSKTRDKVNTITEPTTVWKGVAPGSLDMNDPVMQEVGLNFIKRTGRVLFGVADFAPQAYGALKDALSDDPKLAADGEDRLNAMHPGAQVVNRVRELKSDIKKDPKLAAENVAGDIVGMWITKKIGDVAPEAVRGTIGKSEKAANFLAKEVVGIRPKTAADAVAKTVEENAASRVKAGEKNTANAKEHLENTQEALHNTQGAELEHEAAVRAAKNKAEEANANAAKEHLKKTQEALHETSGKELEHQAKVKADNDKAQADHAEAVAKVKEHNDRVTAKHEKVATRIKEENAAADHALELRRQREAELQKETDAYYAKEDAVKAKAKAEENAAWQPWHEKMEGVEIDGGRIAEPLGKIAAVSPDIERMLRQLIPDPADASPDSLYAQDRKAIMLSRGYPEGTDYWDLSPEKRIDVDKIAASSGFEPDPIDFDPQAGKGVSVEQVHRAKSILGRYIRSGRYEGHLLGELKQVYKVMERAETRASLDNGAMGDLEAARKATQRYQDAFGRERHVPRTQDEIRKQQANPEQFKEENDQERVDAAGKHSQELVDAHEKVKALREELKKMQTEDQLRKAHKQVPPPPSVGDLREGYRLKSEPKPPPPVQVELPTRIALPDRPPEVEPEPVKPPVREAPPDRPPEVKPEVTQIGEEDLTEANRAQYSKTIQALRSRGIWYGAALPWLWVARDLISLNFGKAAMNALGAGVSSVLTVAGLTKLADVLEQPAVRDWVAKPSLAEIRELEKLPPEQRKVVAEGLRKVNIVAKKKGYKVSPMIVAYMAANKGIAKVPGQDEEQKE